MYSETKHTPRSKNILHKPLHLLRIPMLHLLDLHHPLLLLQQHGPLGIARKTPVEESSGLLDAEPSVSGERDAEDVAEFFQAEALGFGDDAS
jgi:hypothetical protein